MWVFAQTVTNNLLLMIVLLQWVVFCGTQPTFEFVMQQYCYYIILNYFLLNMKCVLNKCRLCACLIANQV